MAIKESSDELNPVAVTADTALATPRSARSAKDYLALAIGTCGVGYLPLAPGTWGSLIGVGVYLSLRWNLFRPPSDTDPLAYLSSFLAAEFVVLVVIILAGIWAGSRAERALQVKDPGKVVIDEVAGQLIALLPVPLVIIGSWPIWVIASFLLFRFFDIIKPYPARRLESLESGIGIMADDIVAGMYAAGVIGVAILLTGLT